MAETNSESKSETGRPSNRGLMTRNRGKLLVLSVATFLCVYLTYRLMYPFLPALIWAGTAAIITHRPLQWLKGVLKSPNAYSAVAVLIVALILFIPVVAMAFYAFIEIGTAVNPWQNPQSMEAWQKTLERDPRINSIWNWLTTNMNIQETLQQSVQRIQAVAMAAIQGSLYFLLQTLLALFVLFFLYRDEKKVLQGINRLSPLNQKETTELLQRINDTVHATIHGTVVVAFVQGALGGLIFWLLGLPAALLWGIIMGMLSIIPYLGSFVVWVPAAIYLLLQGDTMKALILTGWGLIVIGLIDNLLYPLLVGERLRQHTVITFVAIVGGIYVFGGTGIVLGPVTMTTTFLLLEIWRRRTDYGAAAEKAA